ncbi:TonB-dependent receptor [Draconibacterium sp. IB214405]|uniref:SusC/RagA family TonB-linked outer membrane protein n=1 Tax=Draconibacterium sp. IB214405 TaxID=3097352 RepID=UPI002A0C22A2|nr:TonB-dependent receptor [Draconibacterium sp. IB214405]MDX8339667.1 TonB-dependent receptor [Draconibacterium sp. IB214405]
MKKIALMLLGIALFGVLMVEAQVKSITGTVTSAEDGTGIPGVSVSVKGTTIGTVTNIDGQYQLDVPNDAQTIVFSFVGMKTIEAPISGSVVNATMEADYVGVEEVIVTGYTSHRKSEVTGSSVQVSGESLANMPVASVDQALQGKIAGVNISSSSGTPGSVQNIRIRGRSSITAGNEPLYVIDGVPMVNGNSSATSSGSNLSMLATLNSNDIESITVLKDASATAAYGARGANGVIVITTKSGKSGKADINFSATYGFSNDAIDGPGVLTGAEREMLAYEALYNTYGEDYGLASPAEAGEWYAETGYFGNDYVLWNEAGRPETDWADLITNENAPMQEYNLSASGGTEGVSYYTSVGYMSQEATVIGSEFERFSGALTLDVDLSPSLKFTTRNNASHSYQDGLLETSAYFSSPRASKFFMPSIDQAYNEDGSINYETTTLPNPLWIAQEDIDDSKLTRILSNNSLTWDTPVENLSFTTRVNIDYRVYNYKRYRNPLRGDGDGATNGYGWQAHRNSVNYVFQNMVNYSLSLDGGHNFDFSAIQEYQENRRYYLDADADNFTDVGLTNLSSAGNPTSAFSEYTDWKVASYLGMVHYSYDGRYVVDLTYRKEGSSRFAPDNRWGDFWAVGGAWNMQRENFMSNVEVVDMLKLRASYGLTGNANISLNQYQALLSYDSDYAGEGASYPGTFGNNDLSWETSKTLDIGVDFGLFQNRISGSIGYYNRETQDMLLDVPLSLTTGFNEQTRNIGRMENKGYEVELNVDIIRSRDMNLSIGGNLGTNKNEVLELATDLNGEEINITSTIDRVETGHPVYGWYMPTWAGVDPDTGDELWYINPEESDETSSNFNDAEQVWQGGSAIPKVTAGLNLHFDFKGAFIDVNGYYAGGHKVYEGWHRYTHGTDVFSVFYYQGVDLLLDRWQQPGDVTRYGKFEYTGRPWQRHSKFLYDGDYFRLKDVTVGYDFNPSLVDAIGLGGVRVFVRGTNLYTWVKDDYLKYDPEVGPSGETGLATPPVKSFIFGVNVKF